ncbi:hypothetical protein TNCV_3065811 [Trichonephila clavipes]|uniref:Uncharacterized protein n=1 Tax=Trichonephila clavipes TaxID=2585209 RepID=A0A8X6V984_TRICX|nr:hypothetical protein TNCV_3065811 [Trichonephila clavipes]
MNSSQHRCRNQVSTSDDQTQQRSLNSSLGDTIGSPLVPLSDQLLNGSKSIRPNASPHSSSTSVIYGPWFTTFVTSLIVDSPILPYTIYFYHGGSRTVHKLSRVGNASTLCLKVNDHGFLEVL